MDKSQIAQTIKEKAEAKNIKLGTMWKETELTNNTLHNMKRTLPSLETITKIADYLDCSVDELIGRQKNNAPNEIRSVLIDKVNQLSDDKAQRLLGYLEALMSE